MFTSTKGNDMEKKDGFDHFEQGQRMAVWILIVAACMKYLWG